MMKMVSISMEDIYNLKPVYMKVTRTSNLTGKTHTKELPVTQEQLDRHANGELAQNVFPDLSKYDREFLISGATKEEWEEAFGKPPTPTIEKNSKRELFNANGMSILNMENAIRPDLIQEVSQFMNNDNIVIVGCNIFHDPFDETYKAIICYYPD